ncbi:MAG: hypothetical protein IV100_00865 [Myxococcales bacterium]|nr:hypothetical protein [Myxococcales bacterium]
MADYLIFGKHATCELLELRERPATAKGIYRAMELLAEISYRLQVNSGYLGVDRVRWLEQRGLCLSRESNTLQKNKKARQQRRFHDGDEIREFDLHVKVSDSTHCDLCTRIYFEVDERTWQIRIGWIGRHL